MATTRDVARLADVSVGTVSKVLNNVKGVSVDKIQRVNAAIKALGYKQNAYAHNLKSQSAKRIDVILPSIGDLSLTALYDSIHREASAEGYTAFLHITYELPHVEQEILNTILSFNSAGVILVTCQPDNEPFFTQIEQAGLRLVFVQRRVRDGDFNFIRFNIDNLFSDNLSRQIGLGKKRFALLTGPQEYSFELECRSAYLSALMHFDIPIAKSYLEASSFNNSSTMMATIRLLSQPEPPEVIYTTSQLLAVAVEHTLDFVYDHTSRRPALVHMGFCAWHADSKELIIPLPYAEMGKRAFLLLLDQINTVSKLPAQSINISAPCNGKQMFVPAHASDHRDTIRVFFHRDSESPALSLFLQRFERQTGIRVEADFNDVENSERIRLLNEALPRGEYDAMVLDLPWIPQLIRQGNLLNLTPYLRDRAQLLQTFPNDVLNECGYMDGQLFSLPFSYSVQLMYYRTDLFQNMEYQRAYFEQNKKELKPPESWESYNRIARFFTRAFNQNSPTKYGATLCWQESAELLPRIWTFCNSDAFDLDAPGCLEALENLIESFQYSAPSSTPTWEEQVRQFADGDVAMLNVFCDLATHFDVRSESNIVGKYGVDLIPGNSSILGGWSFGINAHSRHIGEALEYMNWLYSSDLMIPTAISGRIIPSNYLFQDPEVSSFCPWHKQMTRAFAYAKKRPVIYNRAGIEIPYSVLARRLDADLIEGVRGSHSAREILDAMRGTVDALKNS